MADDNRFSEAALRARQEQIVGFAPRIAPMKREQISDEVFELVVAQRRAINLPESELYNPEIPEAVATLLRHPELSQVSSDFGLQMLSAAELSVRDRELAVLRTAWLCQAPFAWGEHVVIGKRIGLSDAEIEQVIQGSAAPAWNEHERAVIRAVEELYENAMISDETWAILAKDLNDKQLIELPTLVGYYTSVVYLQNSIRLRLREGYKGLMQR